MKKNIVLFLIFQSLLFISCDSSYRNEKKFNANNHFVDVKKEIQQINIENPLLSNFITPYITEKYLIVTDTKSYDGLIHLFDKHTFQHVISLGTTGNAPHEISNLAGLVTNNQKNIFYVIDFGKDGLMEYPIDSILTNMEYIPKKKSVIKEKQVPLKLQLISDTVAYALITNFHKNSDYKPITAKFNMVTGEISYMKHEGHPKVKRKRVNMTISKEHNLFIEAYWHHDLLSFCSLDGNLINYVYGNKWDTKTQNSELYFEDVVFCGNKIFITYWGGKRFTKNNGYEISNLPDKLLVFDIKGNHLHTLGISHPIIDLCYDEDNKRLIFSFEDEMQLGYLDISKWL